MKYLLVIDHIATGGAERILVDYYNFLSRKDNEVYVFCLTGNKGTSALDENLRVVYGTCKDEDNLFKKTLQQIYIYISFYKFISKITPDVVFSFLEKSNLLTTLVPTNATKILSVHNVLSIQYQKIKSKRVRKILYSMIGWMYNKSTNVIAVSNQVKDDLINSFDVKCDNIHVINNYVDRHDIQVKKEEIIDNFSFNSNCKYIMNIGRFSDQKAQWKLLKAFSLYLKEAECNVQLVLMGHGEYTEELKKLAKDLEIENKTTFLPFNINPYKYMKHAHLFVLSSIFEGFPIVLAEISSLRIPFLGTRKAIPQEMFLESSKWEQVIFESKTFESDFTTTIHDDEKALAKLLKRGIEEESYRRMILDQTQQWENNNDKEIQFNLYNDFK